jgi:hypothetical protein
MERLAMLTRLLEAELAVAEYLIGLDTIGLGAKAQEIYATYMARDVAPLLMKQQRLLREWERRHAPGDLRSLKHWTLNEPAGRECDAAIEALDIQAAIALERCQQDLRGLWLREGQQGDVGNG